ncbi:MAG: transposase [Deltaproteobacteria bacterium]|nr:transposase [Deltaproteobacteria bacterium]
MTRLVMNDHQWDNVSRLIPKSEKGGRPPIPRRKIMNGIFRILRTGAPWRDLPKEFGAWQTVICSIPAVLLSHGP